MATFHISSLPVTAQSPIQQLPTPSPFSFSVASTRWSSRPSIHISTLFLRFLALVLSFVSALSLAAPPPKKTKGATSFTEYPELVFSFVVSILVFVYSGFQLFKGISDISHRGIFLSDRASDYASFILDQLGSYLLVSSASITVTVMQEIRQSAPLWKEVVVVVTMSFAGFLVVAACAVFSGYKLCKRIIW